MVNKPLIRPYFLGGGVALGGVARIPLIFATMKKKLGKPTICIVSSVE